MWRHQGAAGQHHWHPPHLCGGKRTRFVWRTLVHVWVIAETRLMAGLQILAVCFMFLFITRVGEKWKKEFKSKRLFLVVQTLSLVFIQCVSSRHHFKGLTVCNHPVNYLWRSLVELWISSVCLLALLQHHSFSMVMSFKANCSTSSCSGNFREMSHITFNCLMFCAEVYFHAGFSLQPLFWDV